MLACASRLRPLIGVSMDGALPMSRQSFGAQCVGDRQAAG
jgi:hypothetical protein